MFAGQLMFQGQDWVTIFARVVMEAVLSRQGAVPRLKKVN